MPLLRRPEVVAAVTLEERRARFHDSARLGNLGIASQVTGLGVVGPPLELRLVANVERVEFHVARGLRERAAGRAAISPARLADCGGLAAERHGGRAARLRLLLEALRGGDGALGAVGAGVRTHGVRFRDALGNSAHGLERRPRPAGLPDLRDVVAHRTLAYRT